VPWPFLNLAAGRAISTGGSPFPAALSRLEQRRWAPLYLKGLLLPGERKSVEPLAARVAPGEVQQLHHFVSASPWATGPLEAELVGAADKQVGGPDPALVVNDTALVKQGKHSVGVQRQYCGELGKRANCQALVSLTLARGEVPVCVGLRLFLPEAWAGDPGRRQRAGVPEDVAGRPKWRIALDEIDRVLAAGLRFGRVLADAEYGKAAEFRRGLSERGLTWAVGIGPTQKVFPADVTLAPRPRRATGQAPGALGPERRGRQAVPGATAAVVPLALLAARGEGAAEGALRGRAGAGRRRPRRRARPAPAREEAWLVCEERAGGQRKYHLADHPADAPLRRLAATIRARWVCEQMHRQMKGELGLDHFEGRVWRGLHHHALLCQVAYAFLQHLRLGGKTPRPEPRRRPAARALAARGAAAPPRRAARAPRSMSQVRLPAAAPPAVMPHHPPS
jgi:SRSO17 transposase